MGNIVGKARDRVNFVGKPQKVVVNESQDEPELPMPDEDELNQTFDALLVS